MAKQIAGKPVVTPDFTPYEDSAQFTDDLATLSNIINHPRFEAWLEDTRRNYGHAGDEAYRAFFIARNAVTNMEQAIYACDE